MSEKLVIDRGEWLTGTAKHKIGISSLYNPKSKLKCCVGIYGSSCGVLNQEMQDRGVFQPYDTKRFQTGNPQWLFIEVDKATNAQVQDLLTQANDGELHPIRREAKIKKLFKQYGDIDVTFTGKYATATRKAKAAVK